MRIYRHTESIKKTYAPRYYLICCIFRTSSSQSTYIYSAAVVVMYSWIFLIVQPSVDF